ncbi:hypothetical protein TNCV_3119451 [Trichonephila clavipes]|uniref:Uncharacterized protein n=1 Tax=Trichonephila clavipes TaxID=2585209 RepID=A0A8X6W9I8_TRICX|nr:hypothetical protein TNCV_3119451 [Trichonephila clavipes]
MVSIGETLVSSGNNIQTSTVHSLWPIFKILDGALVVSRDPDTVLIPMHVKYVDAPTFHILPLMWKIREVGDAPVT